MKKVTLLGFICLAVILVVMSFAACAQQAAAPVTVTAPAATVTSPAGTVTPPTTTVKPPATTVTVTPPAVIKEPTYTVLDPRSSELPVNYQGLTPRLTTLEGKKVIVVNLHGGNEAAIRSVGPDLKAAVPGCNVISYEAAENRRMGAGDWAEVMKCDAVIFGHDF